MWVTYTIHAYLYSYIIFDMVFIIVCIKWQKRGLLIAMVLTIDGNSDHVVRALRKIGLFGEKKSYL